MRGRGSKPISYDCSATEFCASPPVRGRGSKQLLLQLSSLGSCRPPCGGADRNRPALSDCSLPAASPPVRGRGSKHRRVGPLRAGLRRPPCGGADRNLSAHATRMTMVVAPRAGARIETFLSPMRMSHPCWSPPVRGRGSKPAGRGCLHPPRWSPPVRGRGSKLPRWQITSP